MQNTTLSYSGIKELLKSVDHFIHYKQTKSEPTAAMAFGSAFDRFLLEGVPPLIMPEGINLRTNEGKAQRDALLAEAQREHRELVTIEDMKRLQDMKAAVMAHPKASLYLDMPRETQSEFWLEYTPVKGHAPVKLHGKRDIYITETEDPFIIDLKTCNSADIGEIERAIANLKYYIQAMVYMMPDLADGKLPEFAFLFVETEAPYGVQFVQLDVPWLMKAQDDIEAACRRFVMWRDGMMKWTGYSEETVMVKMPGYLANKAKNSGGTICPANMKVSPAPQEKETGAVGVSTPQPTKDPAPLESKATEPVPPVPEAQPTAPIKPPRTRKKKDAATDTATAPLFDGQEAPRAQQVDVQNMTKPELLSLLNSITGKWKKEASVKFFTYFRDTFKNEVNDVPLSQLKYMVTTAQEWNEKEVK